MGPSDILISVLALTLYSGPFLPLLAPLFFRRASHQRFRRNLWTLIITTALHGLSYAPFILANLKGMDETEHALIFPAGLGTLLFVGALVYAIRECIHLRSLLRSNHAV